MIYDLTDDRPYIPGEVAARNALSDAKTHPDARKAARDVLGYTDPLGWDATPAESRWTRWIDAAASAVLIAAVLGVTALVVYILTLPGGAL